MKKYAIFLILILANLTYASGGFFDSIMQVYVSAAQSWTNTLLPIAKYIFWFIASIEFYYQYVVKKVLPNDMSKLWVFFLVRFITASILAKFVLDPNFYMGIVTWMAHLGAVVGGVSMDIAQGQYYSPSDLFSLMWAKLFPIISGAVIIGGMTGFVNAAMAQVIMGFAGVLYILILVIVVVVLLTLIEAYFVLGAGIILAGFAGSSWTHNYWQRYLSYVASVAIRLFATSILVGLFVAQLNSQELAAIFPPLGDNHSIITNPSIISVYFKGMFVLLAVFILDVVLLLTIPAKAASMLNGSIGSGLGEAIGVASAALSGGKAMGMAGQALHAGAQNVGKAALTAIPAGKAAAFSAMRDGMRNNISGDNGSGDDKWKDMIREKGQSAYKDKRNDTLKEGAQAAATNIKDGGKSAARHAEKFMAGAGSSNGNGASAPHLNVDPHRH